MGNIERRIERLENREEPVPEELITFLLELRGFKEKDALGPDPTLEEVLAALRGKNSRLSRET